MFKKLELQGFKTFAGKTEFHFPDGVTAIVGPNGSGKSNLADAVRWILGEQRPAALRAKRNEDMIFSGTEKRARMGMAQGFITLDNSDGLLPLDFSEIVVGRRAFRSGESEYLINGNKVRLRDVHELLAHAGVGTSTYTVIGQGLVDAALSLRAEERRQLFEDAAGLGAYQGKRDESLRRLTQTEEHLTRVQDIIGEIAPRLQRLKRQAERAEEYKELSTSLRDLLRKLYGYRWGQAAEELADSKVTLADCQTQLQAASLEVTSTEKRIQQLRQRQQALRDLLEAGRTERGKLRREAERLRRERAVAEERERGMARQRESLQQELADLEGEIEDARARLEASAAEGQKLETQRDEAAGRLNEAREKLAEAEAGRTAIRQKLEETRRQLGKLAARQGELSQQKSAIGDRQEELARERKDHDQALASLQERLVRREAEIDLIEEELDTLRRQREEWVEERRELQAARQQALAAQQAAQSDLHNVQNRLTELTTRRDVLARLRREGTGYETGVQALLAERKRFGEGLLGPVADQLRVPEHLAEAVGAALATLLQAVVVRDCVTQIRPWLHEADSGRVTLLPLAQLRGPENTTLPSESGILGRGADLVQADDPTLLEHLLGDWLVVQDWSVIEALGPEGDGWNLVTIDGQVLTRGGAIVAGSGEETADTLLAQSREWAELPDLIAGLEAEEASAQEALDEATESVEEIEERLKKAERALQENDRQSEKAEAALRREQRDAEKLQQEREWRDKLVKQIEQELATLEQRAVSLGDGLAQLQESHQATEQQIGELEQQFEAAHPGALRETVERARTQVAIKDEQLANWRNNRGALEETQKRSEKRLQEKQQQRDRMETEAATLQERMATLEREVQEADQAVELSLQQSRPLETEQAQNEEKLAELEELHNSQRQWKQKREEQVFNAQLAKQAAEERIAHLREQIETDLGMVEIEDEEMAHQSLLPIEELVTDLPKVVALPEGLENDVRRLRRRLSYLGAINPDAPEEYAELNERHTFLSEQVEDLEQASTNLREIVEELDQIMKERFVSTFEAIEQAFGDYFTRLFNGGQARLELTEPDNINHTGIEIIARPPGKRSQSISLLSGGERALTAAALLFAILKVSPAPFCVLDEVDAMLDEANIGRFRETLAELARETQFIVITHNRGTIEVARTIYGISHSDPGISEVISLQMEEAILAAKH